MDINRELAIKILRYRAENRRFYFPFSVVCKEYSPEDGEYIEIEPSEWKGVECNKSYKTFKLWENLQNLYDDTTELMAKGFIEKISEESLEQSIYELAKNYRSEWKEELWESEKIEEYGLNEFIGGKADAFEECLYIIRKHMGWPDDKNSLFIECNKS